MKILILLLLVTLLLARGEEFIIYSPDGDVVKCVKLYEQPAFNNKLLQNHTIHETPTGIPQMKENEEHYGWQLWHMNGTRCPKGTIPVRVVKAGESGFTASSPENRLGGHEHAIGLTKDKPKIFGTQATMNVWRPKIENPNEFSLGQIWLTSGSYQTKDLNTIEVGWQVCHLLYSDYQPRLFIYWTADAYVNTGSYNLRSILMGGTLRHTGFIQTSGIVMIEGAISPVSTFGGAQADLTIRIWKDHKLACWWFGIVTSNDILLPVGYWPTLLFTVQTDYATQVQWGGEITNRNISGQHTKTQMGSGYLPQSGFRKAAYMRNLEIALSENVFEPVSDLDTLATHPDHYLVQNSKSSEFGTHLFYGGPEFVARAVQISWRSVQYLCLGLVLLV